MANRDMLSDLEFARKLAEDGQNAPLLGGRVGLVWGVLLLPTLLIHGLSYAGLIGLPIESIGLVWLGFAIIGGIASFLVARTIGRPPGSGSSGNRLQASLWPFIAWMIFAYAISIAFAVFLRGVPILLFDTIIPLAFALSGAALWSMGRLTLQSYLKGAGIAAAIAAMLCTLLVGHAATYFVAAAGVLVTNIWPNLIEIRREPKHAG